MTNIIGSGGGGCFAAGTPVATPNGYVNIESLSVGDFVISYDDKGNLHTCKVLKTLEHPNEEIHTYKFWNGFELNSTPNHWILNQVGCFVEIGTLTEEDCIVNENGHLLPLLSKEFNKFGTVYNLVVEKWHTFIANGLRVHNGGRPASKVHDHIIGSGGGGGKSSGGGHTPTESPDTLRSNQYARLIDCVCEGEIVGLVDGNKSIYLDGTPLQNADGSYNFSGVSVSTRNGSQTQTYLPGFPSVEAEKSVGTKVTYASSVTRTITNTNTTSVRVSISIPRLVYQDPSTGDLVGSTVEYAIDVQSNGGGFVAQTLDNGGILNGKTTTKYVKSHIIALTGSPPWDIRVRRITADSTNSDLSNETWWESYTEIIDAKLTYPNSALVGIQIDASQFSSIPSRAYLMDLMKVQIPSNYDPVARTYTGIWDGTFTTAWTDNPAWCFYDLVTNDRYGLGKFITSSLVDKASLYTIGQYCDELVADGFGGTEPRFTCNLYLQTREDAYKVITNMASIFRAMVYWSNNLIVPIQDSPKSVTSQFTNADVVDGLFTYQGSAAKTRHTVALVTWNDPDNNYQQVVEYVEDSAAVALNGIIETEVIALGCTSRGQAHRYGKWILFSEKEETEVVTFQTGLKGSQVYPGEIIRTSDQYRAGVRHGGRVVSSTASTVTLDNPLTISSGTYTLSLVLPDGTIVDKTITNSAGTYTTVDISPSFTTQPDAYAIWVVTSSSVSPEEWRVISITDDGKDLYTITALEYNSSKYASVEQNLSLEIKPTTIYQTTHQDPITNLTVEDTLYQINASSVGSKIVVGWTAPSGAVKYRVSYNRSGGNIETIETRNNSVDILNTTADTYTIRVTAFNSIGVPSIPVSLTKVILGKSAPPSDVTNFNISVVGTATHLSWTAISDLDRSYYQIRFSPITSGATWESSSVLVDNVSATTTSITVPTLIGTYLIKAVDDTGNYSTNAALIVTNVAQLSGLNIIDTIIEQPTFSGTKINCAVVNNTLKLDSVDTLSNWTTLSAVNTLYYGINGIQGSGQYDFFNTVDLGNVYTSRITPTFKVYGENVSNVLNTWTTLSSVESLSGSSANQWEAILQVRYTSNDPLASPTWSNWANLTIGDYTARAFEFRVLLYSYYKSITPVVETLEVVVDMPDRIVGENDLVCGVSGYSVTYSPAFKASPHVAISAQGLQTGDYYVLSSKTASGFSIAFYDSTNTAISRTFDYVAKGYGSVY